MSSKNKGPEKDKGQKKVNAEKQRKGAEDIKEDNINDANSQGKAEILGNQNKDYEKEGSLIELGEEHKGKNEGVGKKIEKKKSIDNEVNDYDQKKKKATSKINEGQSLYGNKDYAHDRENYFTPLDLKKNDEGNKKTKEKEVNLINRDEESLEAAKLKEKDHRNGEFERSSQCNEKKKGDQKHSDLKDSIKEEKKVDNHHKQLNKSKLKQQDFRSIYSNLERSNLILVNKEERKKKTAEELSGLKFQNSYIYFGSINEIYKEINLTLVITGHESSGRTSFIQTILNFFEERDEGIVFKKYLQDYREKTFYYKFGIDSQAINELIIVETKRFGGIKILLVEAPHFSEQLNPNYSEENVFEEIKQLIINKQQEIHFIITKKGTDYYMNNNMKYSFEWILNYSPKFELHYVYTFYAFSISYKQILKSSNTKILKINNGLYSKKQYKSKNWRKLQNKIDKFFTNLPGEFRKRKDLNPNKNQVIMQGIKKQDDEEEKEKEYKYDENPLEKNFLNNKREKANKEI